MDACDNLRTQTIDELEDELLELDQDYRKKILSTKDYYECRDMVLKVLKEKRQTQDTVDAYKRSMMGI